MRLLNGPVSDSSFYDAPAHISTLSAHDLVSGLYEDTELAALGLDRTLPALARAAAQIPFDDPVVDHHSRRAFDALCAPLTPKHHPIVACMLASIGHTLLLDDVLHRWPTSTALDTVLIEALYIWILDDKVPWQARERGIDWLDRRNLLVQFFWDQSSLDITTMPVSILVRIAHKLTTHPTFLTDITPPGCTHIAMVTLPRWKPNQKWRIGDAWHRHEQSLDSDTRQTFGWALHTISTHVCALSRQKGYTHAPFFLGNQASGVAALCGVNYQELLILLDDQEHDARRFASMGFSATASFSPCASLTSAHGFLAFQHRRQALPLNQLHHAIGLIFERAHTRWILDSDLAVLTTDPVLSHLFALGTKHAMD